MIPILVAAAFLSSGEEAVRVSAYLDADELEVGEEYSIQLELTLPASMDATKAGAPAPFLQLDIPPSVKLVGKELTAYRELASNEFLHEPYERLLKEKSVEILFELIAEPKAGEQIGLNVLGYVRTDDETDDFFFRRRLELPLVALADAVPAKIAKSDWGTDDKLLQIGQKAEAFSLPLADGTKFDLASVLGKKKVIVTTYRAHW